MASVLQQAVTSIQQNDYLSLAIVAAVGYDYILTFPKEVEYIWKKPRSWVSALFILARYFGLCYAMLLAIPGSTFFPGPEKMYVFTLNIVPLDISKKLFACKQVRFQGKFAYIFGNWSFWIFLGAAELVMILRVWALYNQSSLVLGTLLAFYVIEEVLLFVSYVIYNVQLGASDLQVIQVLQFSFCVTDVSLPIWLQYLPIIFQITLGTLMCLLVAIRLVQELLQKYRATHRVGLNRYTKCLVREGMIYFIVILMISVFSMLNIALSHTTNGWLFLLNAIVQTVPPVTLVPRFILNLRELYARSNVQDWRGSNDTAFGLGSGFEQDAFRSAILFANHKKNGSDEWGDEIEMDIHVGRTSGLA